jgi:metastasis-associated protein MTA
VPHSQYDVLPDGTLLYERVPNKPEAEKAAMNNISPSLLKRRAYEEVNGVDGQDLH